MSRYMPCARSIGLDALDLAHAREGSCPVECKQVGMTLVPDSPITPRGVPGSSASERYERTIIPCAGRFTIAEAAVDAGWKPERLNCSDISIFSSVLGYACAEMDLEGLAADLCGGNVGQRVHRARVRSRDSRAWPSESVKPGIDSCARPVPQKGERDLSAS